MKTSVCYLVIGSNITQLTINRSTQITLPDLFVIIVSFWVGADIIFFLHFFYLSADSWISNETFIAEIPECGTPKWIWRLDVEWFHLVMVWRFLWLDSLHRLLSDCLFPLSPYWIHQRGPFVITSIVVLFIWNILTYIGNNVANMLATLLCSKIHVGPSIRGSGSNV